MKICANDPWGHGPRPAKSPIGLHGVAPARWPSLKGASVFHYFKRLSPRSPTRHPLDPIREELVMSLVLHRNEPQNPREGTPLEQLATTRKLEPHILKQPQPGKAAARLPGPLPRHHLPSLIASAAARKRTRNDSLIALPPRIAAHQDGLLAAHSPAAASTKNRRDSELVAISAA